MFKIFLSSFLVLAIFCVSNFIFEPLKLYYILPYLDIPMHIFGGFAIGFMVISILEHFSNLNIKVTLLNILIAVLFVGIIWEVYEYIYDILEIRMWGGMSDTIKDLFDDLIGAAISFKLCQKSK